MERIIDLPSEAANGLIAAFSDRSLVHLEEFNVAIQAVVESWSADEIDEFITNLVSISALRTSHHFEVDDLTGVVVDLLRDQRPEADVELLQDRLSRLLLSPGLFSISKAFDVRREFDRLLHISRIVTDMRPVFDDDVEAGPLGAVIVHNLRFDYYENGRMMSTSFAITPEDLTELGRAIDRAESKAAVLSRLLHDANVAEFLGEDDE